MPGKWRWLDIQFVPFSPADLGETVMKANRFTLAIGLSLALLAMQAPHLAQAKGGGEQEVINTTAFPAGFSERQRQRNLLPPAKTTSHTKMTQKTGSKGFFGFIRRKN